MVFAALMVAIVLQSASGVALHASDVRNLITRQGAAGALSSLFQDDSKWDAVLEGVATGTPEWLSIAADLRSVSDAHATETLVMAIQEALPKSPRGVLRLVTRGTFTTTDACGMYGFGQIEDERPVSLLLGLVDKRIAAVSHVDASELATARQACLQELRILRRDLQGNR